MDELERQFMLLEPALKRLEEEVLIILKERLRRTDIKIHSVVSRTKSLGSLRNKIVRKKFTSPIGQVDDLVGVRIVCLLRSDIARLGAVVRQLFSVITEDDKIGDADVSEFGYQSTHFVVRLPGHCAGPRYLGLSPLCCEIQVRTLAMDTWAAMSHYLDYKHQVDIPRELRRDFFALSALLHVVDTQFELFYAARQQSKISAAEAVLSVPTSRQELNLDTLTAYLRKRYPERQDGDWRDMSELLSEIVAAGYDELSGLHGALDATADAFSRAISGDSELSDTGVVRISLAILDAAFAFSIYGSDPFGQFRPSVHMSNNSDGTAI
jgi:putative GTP pyrophosphokinase